VFAACQERQMEPRPSTVDALLAQLRERHGAASVSRGAAVAPRPAPPPLPTGIPALDAALPGGGLPRDALAELVGPPSAGATSLALRAVARAQAEGDLACVLDLGATFAPAAAAGLGVDLDALAVARPATGAEAALVVHTLLARRAVGALLVDSLPRWLALPGGRAALAALLRRLPRLLAGSGCALLALNPLPTGLLPDPDLAPLATLAPVAALRLRLTHAGWLRRGPAIAGARARADILRPPFAAPWASVGVELYFESKSRP
jgi:hypothetical protein